MHVEASANCLSGKSQYVANLNICARRSFAAAEMVSGQQLSCRCYLEDLYKHTHVSMDMMWVSRPITVLLVSS